MNIDELKQGIKEFVKICVSSQMNERNVIM